MDLTAELTVLSHGLHRERRLIELTVNRLHLAALVLEHRNELPPCVSLAEVHRALAHLHDEELCRAVLVAGIAAALGMDTEPVLLGIIACAPQPVGACLADRRDRLVRAIDAADMFTEQLRLNALEPVASRQSSIGAVITLDPKLEAEDLVDTARRVAQPSLRHFLSHSV
jgi:hypothetical protein